MVKFEMPPFELAKKQAAVYRLWFDEKRFYIGSSVQIRQRLNAWKHHLLAGNPKNRDIKFFLPEVSIVRAEIIEFVADKLSAREREDYHITIHFKNPFCLNLCPNSTNNNDRRSVITRIYKIKQKPTLPKKVAQVDLNGNVIEIFKSIGLAERKLKMKRGGISKIIKGQASRFKNFSFRLIGDDGNLNDIPEFKRKEYLPDGKLFYQLDLSGNIVAEFNNLAVAARAVNGDPRNIWRVLHNVPRFKRVKGYAFKYA